MSTSGRLAKKVETKRRWEELFIDYKEPIVYFRYVFVWERPVDFGLLLALVTFGFRFYFKTETTVLSMIGSLIVAWALGLFLTLTSNFKIPWASLVPPQRQQEASGNPVDYYGEVIGFFVSLKYALVDFIENSGRIRATNPTAFIVQTTLFGALLAFLGSYVSGAVLFFLTFYTILLLPGIIANRIPSKVVTIVEPHVRAYLDKAKYYLQQGIQHIQAYIAKKQNKYRPPPAAQSPPRPAAVKKDAPVEQELVSLSSKSTLEQPASSSSPPSPSPSPSPIPQDQPTPLPPPHQEHVSQ